MSLENKIEELTAAIEKLTETLLRDAPQTTKRGRPAAKAKVEPKAETVDIEEMIAEKVEDEEDYLADEYGDDDDAVEEVEEVAVDLDSDTVKEFAKKKIASGAIGRDEVKAEVKRLGADQLSNLKADALVKLYNKLKALA